MAQFIVEKIFEQPLSNEEVNLAFGQLEPCLKQYGVNWLYSFLSKDRLHMLCTFEAADAESIRMAHRIANIPYKKILVGDVLTPKPLDT